MNAKEIFKTLPKEAQDLIIEKKKKGLPILKKDLEPYISKNVLSETIRSPAIEPEQEQEKPETVTSSFSKGLAEGATFNFADEIAGLAKAVKGEPYKQARDEVRQEFAKAREEAPISNVLGNIIGGIGTTALGTAAIGSLFGPVGTAAGGVAGTIAGIAKTAPKLYKLGKTLLTAGTAGALYGAGEAKELSDIPEEAKSEALTGIAATGAFSTLGRGLKKAFRATTGYIPSPKEGTVEALKEHAESLKEKAGQTLLKHVGVTPAAYKKLQFYQLKDNAAGRIDKIKKSTIDMANYLAEKSKEGVLNIKESADEITEKLEKHMSRVGKDIEKTYGEIYKNLGDIGATIRPDRIKAKFDSVMKNLTVVEREPYEKISSKLMSALDDELRTKGKVTPQRFLEITDFLDKSTKAIKDTREYYESGLKLMRDIRKEVLDEIADNVAGALDAQNVPEETKAVLKQLGSTLKTLNTEYHKASTLHTLLEPAAIRATAGSEGRIWAGAYSKLLGSIGAGLATGILTGSAPVGLGSSVITLASLMTQNQLSKMITGLKRAGQISTANIIEKVANNLDKIPLSARAAIIKATEKSPKSVIATHYLLTKSNPEYSKIMRENKEEK